MFSILPQGYPFVMIDEVVDIKIGESLVAIKNITANEWIFQNQNFIINHLPESFLIEAAAQAALVLHCVTYKSRISKVKYILGQTDSVFNRKVFVGEQLEIKAFASKMLLQLGYMDIELFSNQNEVAAVRIFYKTVNIKT
jgi:3-hydroxyacyl-[acyl-carrier-protein] dehydratase